MNLRPFKIEDANLLASWIVDPEYQSFFRGWAVIPSYDDLKNYPHFMNHVVLTVLMDGDRAGGFVTAFDFNPKSRTCRVGIALSKEYKRKGHVKEVLLHWCNHLIKNLGIRKVKIEVIDEWAAQYAERIGFKREGVLREETFMNGKYHDEILLSMTELPF